MQTIKKNVDEKDYQAAIKLIKSMNFSRLLSYFNEEELVILLLRFGFINENYFSIESISNFFEISTDEVLDIVKRLSSLSRKDTENLSLTGGKDLIYDILLSGNSKIKKLKP